MGFLPGLSCAACNAVVGLQKAFCIIISKKICYFSRVQLAANTCTITQKNCMKPTDTHNDRIANMTFASVYPMYVLKVEKKGRTKDELHEVITWLTGFNDQQLQQLIDEKATFETFFQRATINPNAQFIKGVICGYRIEEIENTLTRQVRYLDKLVDELAKGRKMEKILRTA